MITGKIILKSATKLSLDKRFSDLAKYTPPPTPQARVQQQTHVIIPRNRQELFVNGRRSNTISIAQRLKKRSINYRLGLDRNTNGGNQFAPRRPQVFQRLGFNNRRQQGVNSYIFGGQSGLGVRLRGQGRVGGPRTFRSQTRGYLNNNAISRFSRGNRNPNNRGRRSGPNNNNNNNNNNINNNNNRFNRNNRGGKNVNRGGSGGRGRGRGRGRGARNKQQQ